MEKEKKGLDVTCGAVDGGVLVIHLSPSNRLGMSQNAVAAIGSC